MLTNDSHPNQSGLLETGCKPEQILKGAMQVFLKYGYAGTSMDRVATEAGVSKHTIYNHFQNKEGLFLALFERLVLRHFHVEFGCEAGAASNLEQECGLPLSEPPEKLLRRIADIFFARADDPEYIGFVRLLFAESGRFPELAQLYLKDVVYAGDRILGQYLKAHPDLNVADPEMAARIFMGSIFSFIACQQVLHGQDILPLQQKALVDSLIAWIVGSK